jgi:predicted permease
MTWSIAVRGQAMQTLFQDLRYSFRQLIRSPGFGTAAVISLALGIGATTAVFSVIYAALVNPYPYPTSDRIVRLTVNSKAGSDEGVNLNGPQIEQLRRLRSVQSVLAMDYHALTLTGRDLPENVNAIGLIKNGFNDLGVPPILGRSLLPSDAIDGQDPQPVAVVSYKFWQKHFFGNPAVIGQTLQLDRMHYQIVGVAAPRFIWYSADVYLPLKLTQDPARTYLVDILLNQGVTHDAANAELQPLLDRFARDMPKHFPEHFKVHVEGLNEWVVRSMGRTLYLLFGAVALLLAIGCGNVSILLLARGTARQHELAVRSAVGADRRRIVRQLLTESLLLSIFGAAVGILMAYGILTGIQLLLPRYAFAPEVVIHINLFVLFFSIAVAFGTGVLFGLSPALQLSRPQISQMMQSGTRRTAGSVSNRRTHRLLIAGQIALTLMLLVGAGSAMASFAQLIHESLGYDSHNVMSVGVPLHDNSYTTWAERAAYFDQLQKKVGETPGVKSTAISSNATPPRSGWSSRFEILGRPAAEQQMASINLVNPAYFAVLRIPLLQGRVWNEAENRNGAHIAVINQAMARLYFPDGNAVGHSIKLPGMEDRPPVVLAAPEIADSWLQIVGIVADSRNDGLRNPVSPGVFIPYTLSMGQGTQILVRSEVPPLTLLHDVRAQLSSINSQQQVDSNVDDLDSWISEEPEWQQEHLVSWICGVFAALALALAAVGLFSVVSYTVAQRTNEFGIRMALGAQRGHVLRIVFKSIFVSVGSGIVAGVVLTLVLNKILGKWVDGSSHTPVVLATSTLLLVVVAGIACAIPARKASHIDPMAALHTE